MAVKLTQHIELRGENPRQAVIAGTNFKAYLVSQFVLGWGVNHAVEKYGLSKAQIYAAMSFYYDNLSAFEAEDSQTELWLKDNNGDGNAKIAEFKRRLDSQF